MGQKYHVSVNYIGEDWRSVNDKGTELLIGGHNDQFAPYELLLSALSSCVYMTFESILEKMQISVAKTNVDVRGEKRDDKIASLKTCQVTFTIEGAEDEKKAEKAVEIATRYCSIYYTLSKVADMSYEVKIV